MLFSDKGITAALEGMKIRTNYTGLFSQFQGQKYLVAGRKDPVLTYTDIEIVAVQCNCKLLSFPNGHLSFIENEKELNQFLHFID